MVHPNKEQSGMIYYNHAYAESRKLQSHKVYILWHNGLQNEALEELFKEVCKHK